MIEILLFIVIALLGAVIVIQLRPRTNNEATGLIKQDLDRLDDSMHKLREGLSDRLGDRLDQNQALMLKSIQRQFAESTKLVSDVTKNLTELKETNKQVIGVTDELKTLQNILQNPKQRGVVGEYYLETVLKNILPPERYSMQYKFADGEIVDAVVILDKNKLLSIDSKFSLENYNRLVEAQSKAEREVLTKTFRNDLKLRIDETAKYIRPNEDTLDYAFMFIPSEAIYYDLLANRIGAVGASDRDLIEYAFVDKHVIIVSPTTFTAYLQTVLQGLRSLQIEERAKEIQKRVGQLGRHLSVYEQLMQKLGGSLGTTVNHFNNAHKELKKVDKDVVRIADTSPAVEPLLIDKPVRDDE